MVRENSSKNCSEWVGALIPGDKVRVIQRYLYCEVFGNKAKYLYCEVFGNKAKYLYCEVFGNKAEFFKI